MAENSSRSASLNLKAGDWVEVRSAGEIMATLDERGRCENLPFMPEMLAYCGKRFRVIKRADKTCDPAHNPWSIRRLTHTVHLEDLRCDGTEHGGCQAGCLIFWNEAWLKPIERDSVRLADLNGARAVARPRQALCTIETVRRATEQPGSGSEPAYSCQATELRMFSSPMRSWDPRQYIRDVRSGNVCNGLAPNSAKGRIFELVMVWLEVFRAALVSTTRGAYPSIRGKRGKTPLEELHLQPGELVQVRSKEEIIATLNEQNRNRGLLFDGEMLYYCGGIYRVLRRVNDIIDEKTGKMLHMNHPCIILEGVACRSDYHRLCPRAIYHYWRENWLRRVKDESPAQAEPSLQTCEKC